MQWLWTQMRFSGQFIGASTVFLVRVKPERSKRFTSLHCYPHVKYTRRGWQGIPNTPTWLAYHWIWAPPFWTIPQVQIVVVVRSKRWTGSKSFTMLGGPVAASKRKAKLWPWLSKAYSDSFDPSETFISGAVVRFQPAMYFAYVHLSKGWRRFHGKYVIWWFQASKELLSFERRLNTTMLGPPNGNSFLLVRLS